MKKFLTFIIFIITQVGACDTLFILQDAGETHALLPVIEQCHEKQENFLVLTGGTATEILEKKAALKDKTITYAQLGIEEKIDKSWRRDQRISEESLNKITTTIQAIRVVTGVAFELHGQLLQTYKAHKSTTFAYWDNINLDGTDPYFQTAKKVAELPDHLMVPTATFQTKYPKATVVGQPALELWKGDLTKIDRQAVRAKLPFKISSPVIAFIGGYGDEYNEALKQFLSSVNNLSTVLLTYHPKMEGKVEKQELSSRSLPNVHLVDSSMEAIALADHVICHQSTVGVQAALAGKHVIYFIPSSQSYTNILIQEKVLPKVSSAEELHQALQGSCSECSPFKLLKMPKNGQKLIYTHIHNE